MSALASLMAGISSGNIAQQQQAQADLNRSMTPEQQNQYLQFVEDTMTQPGVPKSIQDYYHEQIKLNTPAPETEPKASDLSVQITTPQDILKYYSLPVDKNTGKRNSLQRPANNSDGHQW